jgi:hypothetical protein
MSNSNKIIKNLSLMKFGSPGKGKMGTIDSMNNILARIEHNKIKKTIKDKMKRTFPSSSTETKSE